LKKKAATKKKTKQPRGRPFPKGVSGNPRGRPKGVLKEKKQRVSEKMLDATDRITDAVIEKAEAGDLQAAALILARTQPTMTPQCEKVIFDLNADEPLTKQVEQIIAAIATGKISATVAKQIIDSVNVLAHCRQVEELEMRLDALEAAA